MTKRQIAAHNKRKAVFAELTAAVYETPIMRKAFRAQLAACVYSSTQTNYAENSLERRVAESLQIADKIMLRA